MREENGGNSTKNLNVQKKNYWETAALTKDVKLTLSTGVEMQKMYQCGSST